MQRLEQTTEGTEGTEEDAREQPNPMLLELQLFVTSVPSVACSAQLPCGLFDAVTFH